MRILIADGQSRVRYALKVLLEQQPNWSVVGEAGRFEELLERVRELEPDLLLLDWVLPGKALVEALAAIRGYSPDLRIIFLSETAEAVPASLAAKVDDLASKTNPPDELLAAIQSCEKRREGHGEA